MTIRRFHYTGRKRLNQEHVKIVVRNAVGLAESLHFDAELSLAGYDLPPRALISVEAYRQTSWMRFFWGNVANVSMPKDRSLSEFDSPYGILFRVRVTSSDTSKGKEGLLLAEADNIQPSIEGIDQKQFSLLPVRSVDDLEEQVFRIDFADRPILLVNDRVGDWKAVVRDPIFRSLVWPAAMREVLTYIICIEGYTDTKDPEDWKSQWLRFATRLPGVEDVPSGLEKSAAEWSDWIDSAIASFCRRHTFLSCSKQYWTGSEDDYDET